MNVDTIVLSFHGMLHVFLSGCHWHYITFYNVVVGILK